MPKKKGKSTAIQKGKKEKKQPLTRIPKEKGPELSMETVKKYINKLATDEEAYMFLQLCKAQKLNPFIKEAYLIKYSASSPGTMVVGKDVFTKRADHHPQYDGTKAGIILKNKTSKELSYREGSFVDAESEILVGGWAETFRKDRKIPYRSEVSMAEYSKGQASWNKMPATMIRKVALVQSLREAFPDMFQGLYDSAEMGVELIEPKNVTDEKSGPKETKVSQPATKPTSQPPIKDITPESKKPEVIEPEGDSTKRRDIQNDIIALCKEYGCKTTDDAKTMTGVDSLENTDLVLLEAIKRRLEKLIKEKNDEDNKSKKPAEVNSESGK